MELLENEIEGNSSKAFCKGMIISVHKDRYEIMADDSCMYFGRLKSAYYRDPQAIFPTVGDNVCFENIASGDVIIVETLPRHSCFFRANPTQGLPDQAVAANFDYVVKQRFSYWKAYKVSCRGVKGGRYSCFAAFKNGFDNAAGIK